VVKAESRSDADRALRQRSSSAKRRANRIAYAATELANRCLDAENDRQINRVLDLAVRLDPSSDPNDKSLPRHYRPDGRT
jgi:hypothetical protein